MNATVFFALLTALSGAPEAPVRLTLAEALEIALVRSYTLRQAAENLEVAKAQTRQAWGTIYPSLDLSASYQRNIVAPNPFAGSSAGNTFSVLGWLISNELARTDPGTGLIVQPLDQYLAGLPPSGNPFLIENQFRAGLTLNQILYNGSAFAAIRSSKLLTQASEAGLDREAQRAVHDAARAFYGTLLAEAQAKVLEASVNRAREASEEAKERVLRGVAPELDRLSAEVELANQETQLLEAGLARRDAEDRLKLVLGFPPQQEIELSGEIRGPPEDRPAVPEEAEAVKEALAHRPDYSQAQIAVQIYEADEEITSARYLPLLSGFVNLGLVGSVPDDRAIRDMLGQPTGESEGFFSSAYWFGDLNLGVRLSWNLFDGFRTTGELEQKEAETRRARVQTEQLAAVIRGEIRSAIRSLKGATERIEAQSRNVSRAELNYEHAEARVREGVATPLELRSASAQLDATRLSHLRALHDYEVATIDYQIALGRRPGITPPKENAQTGSEP